MGDTFLHVQNYMSAIRSESTTGTMISLKIFPSQKEAATLAAHRAGMTRSKLIRTALDEYLMRHKELLAPE